MISDKTWIPADGLTIEKNGILAIKDKSNVIVLAGPGAGKTEILAQKANYLLTTDACKEPKKILALSFKKDAAENLSKRVKERVDLEKRYQFVSMTFEAFAKNLLDRFLYALPDEWRPRENYEVDNELNGLAKAFSEVGVNVFTKKEKNLRNEHLTDGKIPLQNSKLDSVWKTMLKGNSDGISYLSFKMITRLVIYLLENNPYIRTAISTTYQYVFLDEFQDTTYLQYELFNVCFLDSQSSVTAVGDDRQKIMSWAGAMDNSFEKISSDYNSNKYTLVMNHRSAPKLLKIQEILHSKLSEEPFIPVASDDWNEKSFLGTAQIWNFNNIFTEASTIAKEIEKLSKEGIPLSEIGILVKQLPLDYAEVLIPVLEKNGIQARNEVEFQDLLKEKVTQIIIHTLRAALDRRDADSWVNVLNIKTLFEGEAFDSITTTSDDLIRQSKIFLRQVNDEISKVENYSQFESVVQSIIVFYKIKNFQSSFPEYSNLGYFESMIDSVTDYLFTYFLKSKDWNKAIDHFEGKNTVPIMTIHKSKGLEFNTVFIVGLDDGAFWSYRESPVETTSAFFVAVSRAKERLYCTYSGIRNGKMCDKRMISPLYDALEESNVVKEVNYPDS